jgi:hypothetical protein
MPNGSVASEIVATYLEFGAWIKGCYGVDAYNIPGTKAPVGLATDSPLQGLSVIVSMSADADRLVLMEDLTNGQRIRHFTIFDANGTLYNGTSLGHKHIALFDRTAAGELTVAISSKRAPGLTAPKLVQLAAYDAAGC